jgi:glycosyltransferase involved in cell wall biosynthesis
MALRRIVRWAGKFLPQTLRQQLKVRLRQALLPNDSAEFVTDYTRNTQPVADLGLNVVGYVRSEHGVGESVRSSARALSAAGVPFGLLDFTAGNAARCSDETWSAHLLNRPVHGINLCHVNADQMPRLYAALGRECFERRFTIGHWAWELPEFPDRWLGSFGLVDEVWALSQFTADSLSRKSPVPVVRMPMCVHFQTRREARRADFGLPEDRFLFLTMYDTQSFQERKNPEGAIAAFRQAFPNGGDVGLVVKINHPDSYPEKVKALKARLADVPGAVVIDRTLTRQEVYDLEGLCDAFVSLHRAEGFGLGLAEAMFLGKPVVATHWSGNVDFMTVANSCPVACALERLQEDVGPYEKEQTWAEPDVEHAAWHMQRLVADSSLHRKLGQRARETIRTQFSPTAVGQLYRQRLALLAKKAPSSRLRLSTE